MSSEAVPDKLLKVTVHGANIATTLYAVTAGVAPCDGLLFGETNTITTQHLRDDDDMATVTESRAAITSTLCYTATCSFYDEAGELSESRLEELTAAQPAPLLGWLSYRPAAALASTSAAASSSAGSLRPSMREHAVTLALLRRQLVRHGGRQAVLLLLLTSGADHNGATITWQFRCFQARLVSASGELLLEPLELTTTNLGGHTGQADYQQLAEATATATSTGAAGAHHLRHHAVMQHMSFASSSAQPSMDTAALAALVAGARGQVAAVKQHCEGLLAGLQQLCGRAVEGEAAVAALRQRRDALLARLSRTS